MTRKIKAKWHFRDSVFSSYKADTDEIINEAFEFDWQLMKKPRISDGGSGLE